MRINPLRWPTDISIGTLLLIWQASAASLLQLIKPLSLCPVLLLFLAKQISPIILIQYLCLEACLVCHSFIWLFNCTLLVLTIAYTTTPSALRLYGVAPSKTRLEATRLTDFLNELPIELSAYHLTDRHAEDFLLDGLLDSRPLVDPLSDPTGLILVLRVVQVVPEVVQEEVLEVASYWMHFAEVALVLDLTDEQAVVLESCSVVVRGSDHIREVRLWESCSEVYIDRGIW